MKTLGSNKFGRTDVIRYIENSNGDNIFIGGNSNFDKKTARDPDDWKLTIYVVNKNTMDLEGVYMSTTAETATYEAAKYIDEMHFDAPNLKWIGTTRSADDSSAYAGFSVWKMSASADGKPDLSASTFAAVKPAANTNDLRCVGMYPSLVDGTTVHFILSGKT